MNESDLCPLFTVFIGLTRMPSDKETARKTDETKFNETLKRMLDTPPKPHDSGKKDKSQDKEEKPAK